MRKLWMLLTTVALMCIMTMGVSAANCTVTTQADWNALTLSNGNAVTITTTSNNLTFETDADVDITVTDMGKNWTIKTGGDITINDTSGSNITSLTAGGNVNITGIVGKITYLEAGSNVTITSAGDIGELDADGDVKIGTAEDIVTLTASSVTIADMDYINGHWDVSGDVTIEAVGRISADGHLDADGDVKITSIDSSSASSGAITAKSIDIGTIVSNFTGTFKATDGTISIGTKESPAKGLGTLTATGDVTLYCVNIASLTTDGDVYIGVAGVITSLIATDGDVEIDTSTNIHSINVTGNLTIGTASVISSMIVSGNASIGSATNNPLLEVGGNVTIGNTGNLGTAGTVKIGGDLTITEVANMFGEYDVKGTVYIKKGAILTGSRDLSGLTVVVEGLEGAGTANDPYEIDALYKLDAIRHDLDAYYVLTADIDTTEEAPERKMNYDVTLQDNAEYDLYTFTAIHNFAGNIDGGGHTISNVKLAGNGLFYNMSGVVIEDIKFENILIQNGSTVHSLLGNLILTEDAYISDITVTNFTNYGLNYAAGIIGVFQDVEDLQTVTGGTLYLDGIHIENTYLYGCTGTAALVAGVDGLTVEATNCTFADVNIPVNETAIDEIIKASLSEEELATAVFGGKSQSAFLIFVNLDAENPIDSSNQSFVVDAATVTAVVDAFGESRGNMTEEIYNLFVTFGGKGFLSEAEFDTLTAFMEDQEANSPEVTNMVYYFNAMVETMNDTITITFDAGEGTCETETAELAWGDTMEELPTASRSGYTFKGWYLTDGTTLLTTDTVLYGSTTVTASWSKNSTSSNTGTLVTTTTTTTTTATDDDTIEETTEETTDVDDSVSDSSNTTTTATVAGMDDVSVDDYYADAVEWAVENEVTTGTSSTGFSPENPASRAQVLTFLYRAFGEPETDGENVFDDVADGSYYSDAVNWALELGITSGMADGIFGTDETCTRAQIITFLWRAAGSPEVDGDHDFSDVEADSYYEMALLWAVENGITDGMGDGTFGVAQPCTRAQIVTFLYRFLA